MCPMAGILCGVNLQSVPVHPQCWAEVPRSLPKTFVALRARDSRDPGVKFQRHFFIGL